MPPILRPATITVAALFVSSALLIAVPVTAGEPTSGVTTEIGLIADTYANLHGGLRPDGRPHTLGAVSLGLSFDLGTLGLWPDGVFKVVAQQSRGRAITEQEVGALQYLSSYDAPEFVQIGEYYLEQNLLGGALRLKVGKQDGNVDFCAPEYGGSFVNCSFVLIPNVPITTYPDQGLGAAAFVRATPWLEIGAALFDGDADGATAGFTTAFDGSGGGFQVVELRARPGGCDSGAERGAYRLGLWRHTEELSQITDNADAYYLYSQNHGLYVELDQPLLRAGEGEDGRGLGAFFQYGWAPGDRNEIQHYFGGGLLWQGPFAGRSDDAIGFGVASARLCRQLEWMEGVTDETTWEAFYSAQVTPWLAVQPDAQYVVNPGGDGRNALAAGLRLVLGL